MNIQFLEFSSQDDFPLYSDNVSLVVITNHGHNDLVRSLFSVALSPPPLFDQEAAAAADCSYEPDPEHDSDEKDDVGLRDSSHVCSVVALAIAENFEEVSAVLGVGHCREVQSWFDE